MNPNQIFLPIDVVTEVSKNDPVRTLYSITEELDYTLMNIQFPVYHNTKYPGKLLFQLIVLGYIKGVFSSRKIEEACIDRISFKWLLQGKKAPDHSTIANFRKDAAEIIEDLFKQLTILLIKMGEIDTSNIFIDGTKIEAMANRYTFVWKKAVTKNDAKMCEKIKTSLQEIKRRYYPKYKSEYKITFKYTYKYQTKRLRKVLKLLHYIKEREGVEFVHGKGKKKHQIQKDIELFKSYLERRLKYDQHYEKLGDRNSYSKTDKDAIFMRMKDDYMLNGQLKPAYNMQIAVSGGYGVGCMAFDKANDLHTLKPFTDYLIEYCELILQRIIADAGYESEENYVYLDEMNLESYIKPKNYEQSQNRNYSKNIKLRENMAYNSEEDYYLCAAKRKLVLLNKITRKSKSGYTADIKVYECEDCSNCQLKVKCTKAKGNRQIQVSEKMIEYRKQSTENITSDYGAQLRMNRSIQVEGFFGL